MLYKFTIDNIKKEKTNKRYIIIIIIGGSYIPLYHNLVRRSSQSGSQIIIRGYRAHATSQYISQLPGEHIAGAAISALTASIQQF